MTSKDRESIEGTKRAAVEVLLHNSKGPFDNLPRTAGWGYPEPYTRDLLIAVFGIAVSPELELVETLQNLLVVRAENQCEKGHIPILVHDSNDRVASDTTPVFLIAVAILRRVSGKLTF